MVGCNGVEPLFDAYQASVLTVGRTSHTLVVLGGVEPPTSTLSELRSNQLNYNTIIFCSRLLILQRHLSDWLILPTLLLANNS